MKNYWEEKATKIKPILNDFKMASKDLFDAQNRWKESNGNIFSNEVPRCKIVIFLGWWVENQFSCPRDCFSRKKRKDWGINQNNRKRNRQDETRKNIRSVRAHNFDKNFIQSELLILYLTSLDLFSCWWRKKGAYYRRRCCSETKNVWRRFKKRRAYVGSS